MGVTALLIIIVFGLWGSIMYHFTSQMPDIGEISPTNWFLNRAIPTTITALAIGAAVIWASWFYLQSAPVTAILGLAGVLMWAVVMYYYIVRLPE